MNEQEKNPFKKMVTTNEVPGEIKEKVMKNVTLLQLFGDITDLFVGKMGSTMKELFKSNNNINH